MKTRSGFTLIELSIVLVIIGLIIGGVLIGRDLIHAAEVRKTITQIEQTKTAVETFRGKYNCLPGDCPNASEFFSGAINGNGTGQLSFSTAADNESEGYNLDPYNAWNHLSLAGLVAGSFPPVNDDSYDNDSIWNYAMPYPGTQPLAPSAGIAGSFLTIYYYNLPDSSHTYFPQSDGNYIGLSDIPYGDTFVGSLVNIATNLGDLIGGPPLGISTQDAFAVDSKMDDGLPLSGSVEALDSTTGALKCAVDGNNIYDFSQITTQQCMLFFPLGL